MVVILTCQKSGFPCQELERFLHSNKISTCRVAIEDADEQSFSSCSLIINAMESYYPEKSLNLLTDFFHKGGHILNLSPAPFTICDTDGRKNTRAIRSFGLVDDFYPFSGTSSFVKDFEGNQAELRLNGLTSILFHFCRKEEDGKNVITAHLEHLLDAFDENGNPVASPILRAISHSGSSMTFFGFHMDPSKWENSFLSRLFLKIIRQELSGSFLLTADSRYARFTPEEEKEIRIQAERLPSSCRNGKKEDASESFTISLSLFDHQNQNVYRSREICRLPFCKTVSVRLSEPSLYRVQMELFAGDLLLSKKETGFLVLSHSSMEKQLSSFSPMRIEEQLSTDHLVQNGKITAVCGTTYFVTDAYRECFCRMNAWLCAAEMAQLRETGFRVLRTGNWVYLPEFYEADGRIAKYGLRALETYFFLAGCYGFTVQFTLGSVMLNPWDPSRSAIHDLVMREKGKTLVRSFAEHFRAFPNVMLDLVNEPSYSVRGAWKTALPSLEPEEEARFRSFLREKYHDSLPELRTAWNETASSLPDFDAISMPDDALFFRTFNRTEQRLNHVPVSDFYAFARKEFLGWTNEIRSVVREADPDRIVTMGRDEILRIPAEQDEVLSGHIDMVCWHQWHWNSAILHEYLLNRVRGRICVAQELGMYQYDDILGGKRSSEEEMAGKLEKKLLYSSGNFIQWEAYDDPFSDELSENALGLFHFDHSPTPSVAMIQSLIASEQKMAPFLTGREYEKIRIATIYNTSWYFSVDHDLALSGIRTHIDVLYSLLKESSDFLPEHLFCPENQEIIGTPRLLILPSMQMLLPEVWNKLLAYVKNGAFLLILGCIDRDEHFLPDQKLTAIDPGLRIRKLRNYESIIIDGKTYVCDFRKAVSYADVSHVLNCGGREGESGPATILEYAYGNGTILYCPLPLELSSNEDAVAACYRYAIQKANAKNQIYEIWDARPNITFLAESYQKVTVYTLINEGSADVLTWKDKRSGILFTAEIPADRGCKLWIDENGRILEQYGSAVIHHTAHKK